MFSIYKICQDSRKTKISFQVLIICGKEDYGIKKRRGRREGEEKKKGFRKPPKAEFTFSRQKPPPQSFNDSTTQARCRDESKSPQILIVQMLDFPSNYSFKLTDALES